MRRQTYGYLPSSRALPALDRYRIILLGDRGTCVNNLPKVVTRKRNGRDSNPRPFESQVQRSITTTPPGHQGRLNWTFLYNNVNFNKLFFSPRAGSAVLRLCRMTWIFACVWVMAVYSSPVIESQGHRSKSYQSRQLSVCLLVTLVSSWGYKSGWTNRDAFGVDFGPNKPCRWGPHLPTHGKGYFWGTYLGMPRLSSGRYTQRSLQGAAAMRLLAAITAAACCRIDHRICLQMYLVYSESLTYSENNCFKSKSGLETVD